MVRVGFAVLTLVLLCLAPRAVVASASLAQFDEEVIREAILRANSDAIYAEAYRTLNPALLQAAWAGEALLDMEEDIEALAALGQYLDLTLEGMEFQRIEPLGPTRVRAVTVERWLARLYQTDGTYLGYQRQEVENRYLLEYRDTDWYIIEADQEVLSGDPVFRPGEP
ncbi:MAG TPA: hypothetical protein VFB73_02855 [Chloroflexota bacterium]|nr:hypothetical protein [Chloroflexota bacterium]